LKCRIINIDIKNFFFIFSPYAENFSIKKQFIKKLLKAFFICQSFLLTPADCTTRVFDGFKIIFLIKENQNLADKTV